MNLCWHLDDSMSPILTQVRFHGPRFHVVAPGQHFFSTPHRDAAAAMAALGDAGVVAGGFCRGQLAMAAGAEASVERLSAVFGFLEDETTRT